MKNNFNINIWILILLLLPLTSCSEKEPVVEEEETVVEPFAYDFVVAQDGSGDFTTVQEALDAAPEFRSYRTYIFIKKGTYKEQLELDKTKKNIALIGEDVNATILTYDNYASKINPETGQEYGTSLSRSFYIGGEHFYAQNITFENSAGPVGQALAVYIQGDHAVFNNCRFLGYQDTVYGDKGRQYFKNCYIAGSTDFIFGPSVAVFDQCTIHSITGNYITAASTPEASKYGYVFLNCELTAEPGVTTYLGRPWRNYARVVYINCKMGDHIRPEGWHNWSKPEAESTVFYAEHHSTGPGANPDQRVSWSKQMSAGESGTYTVSKVLGGYDNWEAEAVVNEISELVNSIK